MSFINRDNGHLIFLFVIQRMSFESHEFESRQHTFFFNKKYFYRMTKIEFSTLIQHLIYLFQSKHNFFFVGNYTKTSCDVNVTVCYVIWTTQCVTSLPIPNTEITQDMKPESTLGRYEFEKIARKKHKKYVLHEDRTRIFLVEGQNVATGHHFSLTIR